MRYISQKSACTAPRCVAFIFELFASFTVIGGSCSEQLRSSARLTTCSDAPLSVMISTSLFLNSTAASFRSLLGHTQTTPNLCDGLLPWLGLSFEQLLLSASTKLTDECFRIERSSVAVRQSRA